MRAGGIRFCEVSFRCKNGFCHECLAEHLPAAELALAGGG